MPRKSKFKYYDIRHLIKDYPDAKYYVAMGERSNGKTYSALDYAAERFDVAGEQFAYVRRFGEDIRPKNLTNLFAAHVENGMLRNICGGKYNILTYQSNRFDLSARDENGEKVSTVETVTIGRAFDLNSMEHYKSTSFPKITTIIFDEFLSRQGYLPNEFQLFQNCLSTIIRLRNNVKIFMLGNTVNKYCPYFEEMGLIHVKEQKQGTVDVYRYSDSGLEVVVEYCPSSSNQGGKESDVYFAFDNPQLKMITEGSWEIAVYPHLPVPYKPKDVAAEFFIDFNRELLHGEIISVPNEAPFVFLHQKTTPVKTGTDIVYTTIPDSNPYHRYGLSNQRDKLSRFINQCVDEGRIFYATNEVGEVFRNYRMWEANAHRI